MRARRTRALRRCLGGATHADGNECRNGIASRLSLLLLVSLVSSPPSPSLMALGQALVSVAAPILLALLLMPATARADRLNLEPCERKAQCRFPRHCVRVSSPGEKPGRYQLCKSRAGCFCLASRHACSCGAQCAAGETCTRVGSVRMCVSNRVLPSSMYLAGEPCFYDIDCAGDRLCRSSATPAWTLCSIGARVNCTCVAEKSRCRSAADCHPGELCQLSSQLEMHSVPFPSPSKSVCAVPIHMLSNRLSGERCSNSTQCANPRICATTSSANANEPKACSVNSTESCMCAREDDACVANSSCHTNEQCVKVGNNALCRSSRLMRAHFKPRPITKFTGGISSPSPSPVLSLQSQTCSTSADCNRTFHCVVRNRSATCEPARSAVCIAVSCIPNHVPLLYASHRVARVLCDRFQNCATEGHVVLFRGRAMMMKSYCKVVECTTKVTWVNSPRYQWRASSFASSVHYLRFTSFAARFGSPLEERLLSVMVAVGF